MKKIVLNTIFGIILVLIWIHFVNLGQILERISKANFKILPIILICMFLSPALRALRLKIVLSEIKKIKYLDLFFLNGAAQMLNFFIPIRAGEFLKGFYLNNKYDLPLGKSVTWIFIDRFLDFLFVFLAVGVLTRVISTNLSSQVANITAIFFLMALIFTYLAVFQVNFSKKIVEFLRPFLIEKHIKLYFYRLTSFVLDSFNILDKHPKDLLIIFLLTILGYAADAGVWYFSFFALNSHQQFLKMYLGQILSGLTYLIPAAPGYVGSAEASGLLILGGVFGINSNLASAMIVLFHILSAIFVLVFGLISVFNLKINLGSILNKTIKRQ